VPGYRAPTGFTVDDTGARHKASNGFCTQIGNEHFTWFGSTESKIPSISSNCCAPVMATTQSINDEAIAYMRERALAGP